MIKKSARGAILITLLTIGCGGQEGGDSVPVPDVHICDGSEGLRFGITLQADVGEMPSGVAVELELGHSFLYVDGSCHYWTGTLNPERGGGDLTAYHEGTLSESDALALEEDTLYARWEELEGIYGEGPSGGAMIFGLDGEHVVGCFFDCTKSSAPELDGALMERSKEWLERLHRGGAPVTGPMRIRTESIYPVVQKTVDWTLSVPPADLVVGSERLLELGDSPLIEDEANLAALRAIRELYLGDTELDNIPYVLATDPSDPEAYYLFAFRDTIPLEDEHGLIPFTIPEYR